MYPDQELRRLAAYKVALRRDIGCHRAQCAEAARRVTQPLAWLQRMLAWCRRFSSLAPFAAVPLGFLLKRVVFRRLKGLGWLMRWGPLVFSAVRGITSTAKTHPKSAKA